MEQRLVEESMVEEKRLVEKRLVVDESLVEGQLCNEEVHPGSDRTSHSVARNQIPRLKSDF